MWVIVIILLGIRTDPLRHSSPCVLIRDIYTFLSCAPFFPVRICYLSTQVSFTLTYWPCSLDPSTLAIFIFRSSHPLFGTYHHLHPYRSLSFPLLYLIIIYYDSHRSLHQAATVPPVLTQDVLIHRSVLGSNSSSCSYAERAAKP